MKETQLSFDLPQRAAMNRETFFVAPSNAKAVQFVENTTLWPNGKLLLLGPDGSGKTHLTHVWAELSQARIVSATELPDHIIPVLAKHPIAIENAHLLTGLEKAQQSFFHLYNLLNSEGSPLLITARGPVNTWKLELRDLQSRLSSVTAVQLRQPDDALLGAVLMKQFADRQLSPTPDTIPYLVRRIDRSFEAVRNIVTRLDEASLKDRRKINVTLARSLLA